MAWGIIVLHCGESSASHRARVKMLPNQTITPTPQVMGGMLGASHGARKEKKKPPERLGQDLQLFWAALFYCWPQAVLNSPAFKPAVKIILK